MSAPSGGSSRKSSSSRCRPRSIRMSPSPSVGGPVADRVERGDVGPLQLEDGATRPRGEPDGAQPLRERSCVAVHLDRDERGRASERAERPCADQRPAFDHHEVLAHPLDLGEEVARHQDRDPELGADAAHEVEHLVPSHRVEPVGRLVEQHQLRVVDERLRELDALPHAGRVAAHRAIALLEEADVAQRLRGALAGGAARQAVHLGHVRDELGRADLERQAVVLRHVADAATDLEPSRGDVEVEHRRGARRRLEQPEQDLDQRALPRPVRAHQPDHARLELELEPVESDDGAVPLGQRAGGDQGHASERSRLSPRARLDAVHSSPARAGRTRSSGLSRRSPARGSLAATGVPSLSSVGPRGRSSVG